jgi:hypothetical protein
MLNPSEAKEQVEVMLKAAGLELPVVLTEEDHGWWIEIDGQVGIEEFMMRGRKSLSREETPGFRCYEWVHHPATRWEPEDRSEGTIAESVSSGIVLEEAVLWFIRDRLRAAVEQWQESKPQEQRQWEEDERELRQR